LANIVSQIQNHFRAGNFEDGFAVHPLQSRFNNSCVPNSKMIEQSGEMVRMATRDIAIDEEVTFAYGIGFEMMTQQERHTRLEFECVCKSCKLDTSSQQLSDLRRRLIRGLTYLAKRTAPRCQQEAHDPSTIIKDLVVRRAAQDKRIPIANHFVYRALIGFLLEQEGLLDDYEGEKLRKDMIKLSGFYQTTLNIHVSRLASFQTTWFQQFAVACMIFGKEDDSMLLM
jgi:hypothetical protein